MQPVRAAVAPFLPQKAEGEGERCAPIAADLIMMTERCTRRTPVPQTPTSELELTFRWK